MCQVSSSHPPSSVHAENPAAMEAKSFGCPEFHRGPHESDPTKFNFIPLKPKFWTLFSRVAGVRFVDVLGSGIDLVRVFTRCFNLPLWKVKNQHSSTSPAEAFQCCFDYPWKRLVSLGVVLDKLRSFPVVVKLAELNRNRMATHLTQEVPIDPPHPVKRKVDQDGVVSLAATQPVQTLNQRVRWLTQHRPLLKSEQLWRCCPHRKTWLFGFTPTWFNWWSSSTPWYLNT